MIEAPDSLHGARSGKAEELESQNLPIISLIRSRIIASVKYGLICQSTQFGRARSVAAEPCLAQARGPRTGSSNEAGGAWRGPHATKVSNDLNSTCCAVDS